MMPPSAPPPEDDQFQISTVSRLTGISVHTIRAWEKRYNVVTPTRTESDRRLYSREDIRRLTLLKTLVDQDHGIGTIAPLTTPQLEARLRGDQGRTQTPAPNCRVAVIGPPLLALFASGGDALSGLEVVARFNHLAEALCAEDTRVDLVLINCPTLFPETIRQSQETVARLGARRALVIYGFSPSAVASLAASAPKVTAVKGPVNSHELLLACLADIRLADRTAASSPALAARPVPVPPAATGEIPVKLFTADQLARICGLPSSLECECPRHLANLIFSLSAFEGYSQECAHRNEEDAELHTLLHEVTARSRSLLESALAEVLRQDGLTL